MTSMEIATATPGNIPTNTFSPDILFPGAVSTVTAAINNSDEIAGFFTDSSGVIHGFIENGMDFTPVDPPGSVETELLGINDNGLAVGFYCVSSGCPAGSMHGLLFNILTDTFTTINPFGFRDDDPQRHQRPQPNRWILRGRHGNTDGLLANRPSPEPSTWIMDPGGLCWPRRRWPPPFATA